MGRLIAWALMNGTMTLRTIELRVLDTGQYGYLCKEHYSNMAQLYGAQWASSLRVLPHERPLWQPQVSPTLILYIHIYKCSYVKQMAAIATSGAPPKGVKTPTTKKNLFQCDQNIF